MFSLAFRTRRYGIEYEYHFIEYEYDKSQKQRNFLAVGCGLNNFAHGRAYSCRKASIGFIFAARVAG
jgi:hypothetical protein